MTNDSVIKFTGVPTANQRIETKTNVANGTEVNAAYSPLSSNGPCAVNASGRNSASPFRQSVSVSGWWRSNDGIVYYLQQKRNRVILKGHDAVTGAPLLEGVGMINGLLMKLRLSRVRGVPATAEAQVTANGRQILGTATSAVTGTENQLLLYRETTRNECAPNPP